MNDPAGVYEFMLFVFKLNYSGSEETDSYDFKQRAIQNLLVPPSLYTQPPLTPKG